jgi:dTDP-4-dehydrorhamnose reductase
MAQKPTYLFTGGRGKLGTCLSVLLKNVSPTKKEMNILNIQQLQHVVAALKPCAIVHMAAISDSHAAEENRSLSYEVNVIGTRNVAQIAKQNNIRMIYISSDYVFAGTKGNYKESDIPNPYNWYGYTKYAGELETQRLVRDYCIVRTSFSPSIWPFQTAYTNVYTTADYVDVIALEIAKAMTYKTQGIIHIGTKKKSMYQLARRRNPTILPEMCDKITVAKRRDLNISIWQALKRQNMLD